MNTEHKIEAILLFKNEPVSFRELAKILSISIEEVKSATDRLSEFYKDRGIVLVNDGELLVLGTNRELAQLIESMQKEELSKDIGRAGLETLAIVLYKGPVSRREIDHIRGVNSGFILRNLLIRGLVERTDPSTELGAGRSYSYKPTLELLRHLGITSTKDLPEYSTALRKMEEFIRTDERETEDN